MRSKLTPALVLTLALGAGSLACSSDSGDNTGSGGSGGSGGSTGGRGGTGGSTGGTGGSTGGTGGSTGGTGGSTGGTGGSTGGTGGSTGGTGGSTGGTGGSTGGTGGSTGGTGGSTGGTGGSADGGKMDTMGDGKGGMEAGTGAFTITGDFVMMGTRLCHKDGQTSQTSGPGGTNKSPALMWMNPPAGTMSFVVTLLDKTNTNIHWAACNIPASASGLPAAVSAANLPMGAQQTGNWYGPGAGEVHQYEYKVWALKTPTLEGGCNMGAQGYKNTLYRTRLPAADAAGSALLNAWGNSGNDCQ